MSTTLTADEIKNFKSKGWLLNKGTNAFSARILTVNGKISAEQLHAVANASLKYGTGNVTFTSRQTIEVLGVSHANIDEFEKAITAAGLSIGGTGPRVRPITACKGTVCPRGIIDTFALSEKIHQRFYLGWHSITLPGKFKIGVGGCPNNCIKPNLNDIGVTGTMLEGGKRAFQITLGGHWGRVGGAGILVPTVFESEESVLSYIEKVLVFYRDTGLPGERFFKTMERIGFNASLQLIG